MTIATRYVAPAVFFAMLAMLAFTAFHLAQPAAGAETNQAYDRLDAMLGTGSLEHTGRVYTLRPGDIIHWQADGEFVGRLIHPGFLGTVNEYPADKLPAHTFSVPDKSEGTWMITEATRGRWLVNVESTSTWTIRIYRPVP